MFLCAIDSSEVGVGDVLINACSSPSSENCNMYCADASRCDESWDTMTGLDSDTELSDDYCLDTDHALFQSDFKFNILVNNWKYFHFHQ